MNTNNSHDISDDSDTEEKTTAYIDDTKRLEPFGWAKDAELRKYQLVGVNWLIERYHVGHGCILADEMGLGKTCQTIAHLVYLQKHKSNRPCLVVSPLSVLQNWEEEVKRFAPGLRILMFKGDKDARNVLAQKIKASKASGYFFDILLTTYELCVKDAGFLGRISWHVLVVDEAHRLKNKMSVLHQTLEKWNNKQCVLLTGTPVQNNLDELYSLLCFVAPSHFRDSKREEFVEKYTKIYKSQGVKELHKLLKPFLLRRTKAVVLKDLPIKSEVILYHGISSLQKKLYKAILTKDVDAFDSSNPYTVTGTKLMNILMHLRKCVNHPYLFDGVEPEPFELGEHLVEASGKLVLIDRLLKHLQATGHKVLMFSQMTHMLDILQDYMGYRGYTYERLDGSVRGEERFLAVQNFNANEETFVFLLSTRAGGQGLNLTGADTVIFVDSDFNPQNDLQAAARAHRIGQTRPVKVMRLIGRNTVEEIVLKRAESKLKLTEKVIEEGEFSLGTASHKQSLITDDKVQLQDILKFGVNTLLQDDESSESDIDFNKILGPSVDNQWQLEESLEASAPEEDKMEADEAEAEGSQSMYVFEGTDYSKEPTAADQKAFELLIEAEKAILDDQKGEERLLRRKTTMGTSLMGTLPDELVRKPRKKMSPEELEERRRKKKEADEKKAKDAEEQELRKAQEQRKKREDLWKINGYTSSNIQLETEEDEEDELSQDDDQEAAGMGKKSIRYVSGDVTRPSDAGTNNNIIVHCADDSGRWGRGGVFTALSSRSDQPQQQYEFAGQMLDLALGDCHFIPIDDEECRAEGNDWLALIIAQHRDKRGHLSGIKLSALNRGLEVLHQLARTHKASVHLPRIGHDTPAFNWYGTERLIRKHLASKGIPTYIYYFPRKLAMKRKATSKVPSDNPPTKVKKSYSDEGPSTSAVALKKSESGSSVSLPEIFTGIKVYLHKNLISADEQKKYKRYLVAYDADVTGKVEEDTTHIVAHSDCDKEELRNLAEEAETATIVSIKWLDDCITKTKLLSSGEYAIDLRV